MPSLLVLVPPGKNDSPCIITEVCCSTSFVASLRRKISFAFSFLFSSMASSLLSGTSKPNAASSRIFVILVFDSARIFATSCARIANSTSFLIPKSIAEVIERPSAAAKPAPRALGSKAFFIKPAAVCELCCNFASEFCTLAKACFVASTARRINDASAMLFEFPVLVFDVSQPAVQFFGRHCEHFVGKFVKPICERIDGEEVGCLPAVD